MNRFSLRLLAPNFVPSEKDVICGRGKQFVSHKGNKRFKTIIEQNIGKYLEARTKPDKGIIVMEIVSQIRDESPNGGFIDRDASSGRWYEIGDTLAREKVGHAIRFTIKQNKSVSPAVKPSKETTTTKQETTTTTTKKLPLKKRPRSSEQEQSAPLSTTSSVEKVTSQENSARVIPSHSPTKKQERKVKRVQLVSLADREAMHDATTAVPNKRQKMEKLSSIMEAASSLITLGGSNDVTSSPPKSVSAVEIAPRPPVAAATTNKMMSTTTATTAARDNTQHHQVQQQRNINSVACVQGVQVITNKMLCTLQETIKSSKESQAKLQEWDREVMGLDKQHSQTMRDTAKSRKDILKVLNSKNKRNLLLKHQQKEKQTILLIQQQRQQEEKQRRRQQQELQLRQQEEQVRAIEKKEIERLNEEKNLLLSALMDSKVKYQQEQHKRRILEQRAAYASTLSTTTDAEALMPRYGGGGVVPAGGALSKLSMKHMMLSQQHHHHQGLIGGGATTGLLSFLPTRMQEGGRTA